jgi:hypothetical protein
MRYTLASDGYFRRDGERFIPVGANWWPGSCGVELWQAWPEDEIRRDLDAFAALGLNSIRFFLRWQDFEPEPGRYEARQFERLRRLLGWCRERDLAANPTLFVGFMSGGIFWPAWREGRNVFSDPLMRTRAVEFARVVADVLRDYADTIFCVDQGNELCCLRDSSQAPPAAIKGWCSAVNGAVRSAWPEAIMISGNEHNQVVSDHGWRLGEQPGCDLLSMHAYPVVTWHPLGFDGLADPLAQSLLPFYIACARAWAPVLAQEFGTIITTGARQQDAYLRGMLPAAWRAGANGFLWWCLRDIDAPVEPYLANGLEGTLGLIDAEGRVKPGLDYFLEFARNVQTAPAPTPAADAIGLYWPRHYYPRDEPRNAANEPSAVSRRLIIANHLLRALGREVRIVRGDQPVPGDLRTLVVAGANLRVDEAQALTPWVEGGGRLLWHGPDPANHGPAYASLLGVHLEDYRGRRSGRISAFGQTWELGAYPRGLRCQVGIDSAELLVADHDGVPMMTRRRLGAGRVIAVHALVEDAPAAVAEDPAARDRWMAFYAGELALLEA